LAICPPDEFQVADSERADLYVKDFQTQPAEPDQSIVVVTPAERRSTVPVPVILSLRTLVFQNNVLELPQVQCATRPTDEKEPACDLQSHLPVWILAERDPATCAEAQP